jgi:hypothetical protein
VGKEGDVGRSQGRRFSFAPLFPLLLLPVVLVLTPASLAELPPWLLVAASLLLLLLLLVGDPGAGVAAIPRDPTAPPGRLKVTASDNPG